MEAIQLLSGREAALALSVTQPRLARAIRTGKVSPDFVAAGGRGIALFLPATVLELNARKTEIFPKQ